MKFIQFLDFLISTPCSLCCRPNRFGCCLSKIFKIYTSWLYQCGVRHFYFWVYSHLNQQPVPSNLMWVFPSGTYIIGSLSSSISFLNWNVDTNWFSIVIFDSCFSELLQQRTKIGNINSNEICFVQKILQLSTLFVD